MMNLCSYVFFFLIKEMHELDGSDTVQIIICYLCHVYYVLVPST